MGYERVGTTLFKFVTRGYMNKPKVLLFLMGMFPLSGHCVLTTYDPTSVAEMAKVLQQAKNQV